jgi:hypothetical protein
MSVSYSECYRYCVAEIDDKSGLDLSGRLLGVYQVQAPIGVGGMGEVYRAVDIKLGRSVAIKILPSHSMSDPALVARFQREARLLATINHPHIGAIYGFETSGDVHALILELIEGDTLSDRLRLGAIPLKDALSIAGQIAEALDAAHSKGIVHRDLKPANIKITPQSVVKVLDFGIAKAVSGDFAWDDDDAPNGTTQIGTIIGTPAFMSPEQARGEVTDKRTDIWAFGCVLYQMLTGRSAFERTTMIDTLAAIVEGEPDLSALPPNTPPHVRRLLQRCFEKDPRRRLRDIGDGILLLEDDTGFLPYVAPKNAWREAFKWAMVAVLFAAVGAGLLFLLRPRDRTAPVQVLKSTILLPRGATLISKAHELPLAVARDGGRIAYVVDEGGHRLLYVREMNSLEGHAIPGTEDAKQPFFSPDGQSIGYFANGSLQTVAVAGGPPLRICDVPVASMGGGWSVNHTIIFASYNAELMRVDDGGGTPTAIAGTKPAAWPEALPDGKTVLFTTDIVPGGSAFATVPIAGGERHMLAKLSNSKLEAPAVIGTGGTLLEAHVVPGYLLYGQSPGVVRAVPFDLAKQKVTGAPISLISSVERAMSGGGVYFGVSQTGLLVYASTGNQHQLVWVDREGNETPASAEKGPYREPRISPNEKFLAFALSDDTRRSDIWIIDQENGSRRRLTTEHHNLAPLWFPDGGRIAFATRAGVDEVPADGGPEKTLLPKPGSYPNGFSPDGKSLLYTTESVNGLRAGIANLGPSGVTSERWLNYEKEANGLRFSPDGRWISYVSDVTGRWEVYVARAPDLSSPVMISANGGGCPTWSKNGRELFFREADAMMSAPISETADGLHAGKPVQLFTGSFNGESHDACFDVSNDGKKFIMVKSDEGAILSKLTVVQNWSEELKK